MGFGMPSFVTADEWHPPAAERRGAKLDSFAPSFWNQARLVRAQDLHRVEPYGAVRGHQARHQRNKGQRGPHGGKHQWI
jgi:hypothetical protein